VMVLLMRRRRASFVSILSSLTHFAGPCFWPCFWPWPSASRRFKLRAQPKLGCPCGGSLDKATPHLGRVRPIDGPIAAARMEHARRSDGRRPSPLDHPVAVRSHVVYHTGGIVAGDLRPTSRSRNGHGHGSAASALADGSKAPPISCECQGRRSLSQLLSE